MATLDGFASAKAREEPVFWLDLFHLNSVDQKRTHMDLIFQSSSINSEPVIRKLSVTMDRGNASGLKLIAIGEDIIRQKEPREIPSSMG